jgi:hypothetical protein
MNYYDAADRVRQQLGTEPIHPFAQFAHAIVDKNGNIAAYSDKAGRLITSPKARNIISENFTAHGTNDAVTILGLGGAAFATTTALVHRMTSPAGYKYSIANIGVQTTPPVMAASGLNIAGVATNAIGIEMFSHFAGADGTPFIVGKDPAFFFRVSLTIDDISGATVLLAGFRRAEVNNLTYTSYADYGAIGTIASAATGAINIAQEINGAGTSPTDTTDTWADAATKVLEIRVSASGVVTYLINGVAPTVTAAQTFDAGDPLVPFIHFINHTDVAALVTVNSFEVGYL